MNIWAKDKNCLAFANTATLVSRYYIDLTTLNEMRKVHPQDWKPCVRNEMKILCVDPVQKAEEQFVGVSLEMVMKDKLVGAGKVTVAVNMSLAQLAVIRAQVKVKIPKT